MKIVTLGSAMQDLFLQYDCTQTEHVYRPETNQSFVMLQEGKKINVTHLDYAVGGGAINTAISFSRLGLDTSTLCKVGTDCQAEFIKSALTSQGVNTSFITQSKTTSTGLSCIIPCPSQDRIVLVHRGANIELCAQDIPWSSIDGATNVYITSLSGAAAPLLPLVAKYAHERSIAVACNPGSSQLTSDIDSLKDALPYIDILILNRYEAGLLMNSLTGKKKFVHALFLGEHIPQLLQEPLDQASYSFNLTDYFQEILQRGPRIVVVTNGAEGVYAADETTIYFHPSIAKTIVSTVGAGDSFGSAFVGLLAQGSSIRNAIQAGSCNSASVLAYLDANTGLLTHERIHHTLDKLDQDLIKTYPL